MNSPNKYVSHWNANEWVTFPIHFRNQLYFFQVENWTDFIGINKPHLELNFELGLN